MKRLTFFILILSFWACAQPQIKVQENREIHDGRDLLSQPLPGALQMEEYLPLLRDKRVGLVVNQSALVRGVHLLDTLRALGIDVRKIFSPEHGFRGKADAGAHIDNGRDTKTGLPIISLYGKNRKPSKEQLVDIDVLVFDIQDVGVRFYTYISTLHYVMEACAENGLPLLLLDRPNPNAHYVDGPVLDTNYRSFVGMHPVPVVYGMTIGEYGLMINGEHWLKGGEECALTVIKIGGYDHQVHYPLPVKPSPNLPNYRSVLLYPSLCLLEPTKVSVGRGTNRQFQVYGHPSWDSSWYAFRPMPNEGAHHPKFEGQVCYGFDLSTKSEESIFNERKLNLSYLLNAWARTPHDAFFRSYKAFDRIAGTSRLREQMQKGRSEEEIRGSWGRGIDAFKKVRAKYLLYP